VTRSLRAHHDAHDAQKHVLETYFTLRNQIRSILKPNNIDAQVERVGNTVNDGDLVGIRNFALHDLSHRRFIAENEFGGGLRPERFYRAKIEDTFKIQY
jgi:hypothetical protein